MALSGVMNSRGSTQCVGSSDLLGAHSLIPQSLICQLKIEPEALLWGEVGMRPTLVAPFVLPQHGVGHGKRILMTLEGQGLAPSPVPST